MHSPPTLELCMAVVSILVSVAFWSFFASVATIYAKEDANYINAKITIWKETASHNGHNESMIITCNDGKQYDIRHVLYYKYKSEIQAVISAGDEVNMYTTNDNDIIELTISGFSVIPFEEGYKALCTESIGFAVLGAILDIVGIVLIIYSIVVMKIGDDWLYKEHPRKRKRTLMHGWIKKTK